MSSGGAAAAAASFRAPFTATQWQELEHQALIFKHLLAGVPVPPELLIPIRRSSDEIVSSPYYHHHHLGYSYYGKKKPDPEPGRCRRTDGKKWRCSKDSFPGSKYCERHMQRGKSRSRKPVEIQTLSGQPPIRSSSSSYSSSSTAAALGGGFRSSGGGAGEFQYSIAAAGGSNPSQTSHADLGSFGIGNKDYFRCYQSLKPDVGSGEYSFFSGASGSARGIGSIGMDSTLDVGSWHRPMPSRSSSSLHHPLQALGQPTISSLLHGNYPPHPFSVGDIELCSTEPPSKPEATRRLWSDFEVNCPPNRAASASYSATQLSISIPMASSDVSATSSRSPNDD